MKKILYIPLDERPCNYVYPQHLVNTRNDVQLIFPPREILGNKKEAADVDRLWEFVFANASKVEGIVLSVETLVYGGLLPSRLHHLSNNDREKRMAMFRQLRALSKVTPIYASCLIMRTPKFNTSDEEPDYYELYGRKLFRRAYLQDKKQRVGLDEQEANELTQANDYIPKTCINDYESRRRFNVRVTLHLLELVDEGVIDFLSIPQDDSSIFGYTASDQEIVYSRIVEKRLQSKVLVYPGADEAGCTLITRMLNKLLDRKPSIYYFYSSTIAPTIVPLHEDRPMNESVKAHLLASGCEVASMPEAADFILAINAPGKFMEEAVNQTTKDITYSSFRQLGFFVEQIQKWVQSGKPVVIADNAFANGGDQELIQYLDDYQILEHLLSFKGWNTNCNTLGTSIAAGVFGFDRQNQSEIKKHVLYHILDDVFYQSQVRKRITDELLPALNANYFDLNDQDHVVEQEIQQQIMEAYKGMIKKSFRNMVISELKVYTPWSRMFEVGLELNIINE